MRGRFRGSRQPRGAADHETTIAQKTHQDRAARAAARDAPLRWGDLLGCKRPGLQGPYQGDAGKEILLQMLRGRA